jgi:DUF4097 and DUF4098 domain-containing protein YvlB
MSSYPPPPPPGQPYPPYDRNAARAAAQQQRAAAKAQLRAFKDQRRYQQMHLRAQRRSLRRGSIVGPLLLLAVGIAFLLAQLGRISWMQTLDWYGRWWPAVLIVAGCILLAEWAIDQRTSSTARPPRSLGGGVVALLIFLVFVGLAFHAIQVGLDWRDQHLGTGYTKLDQIFGNRLSSDDAVSSPIPSGGLLVIRNPHGDVTVTGTSTDGQVHVSFHTQTYSWQESDANEKTRLLRPTFSTEGDGLVLTVATVDGGQDDLTIEVPRNSPITLQANHGDVRLSQLHGAVTVSANNGDLDLSNIDGPVTAHLNDDDATVNAHSLSGGLSIDGPAGDTDIADITGAVTLRGDFFGTTHLQHVNGALLFESSRTHFEAARLDGEFEIESKDLTASDLLGPVILTTRDKQITLDRVQGSLQITNRNGSVSVTQAPPVAPVSIQNVHGSVDLGLSGNAGFVLTAQTRNGDVENDFSVPQTNQDDVHTLHGTIAGGGPTVTINTTDGDLTLRKTSLTPLPPAPSAPPLITLNPPAHRAAPRGVKPSRPLKPPVASTGTF